VFCYCWAFQRLGNMAELLSLGPRGSHHGGQGACMPWDAPTNVSRFDSNSYSRVTHRLAHLLRKQASYS